jgi:tetratricopeptide (TPR) repeat protein
VAYLKHKEYERAVQAFTDALAHGLRAAKVYLHRGKAYYALKRYDEALADLSDAIRLRADDPYAYWLRSGLYERMDRHREAIDDLTRGLAAKPGALARKLYAARGANYLKLGEFEQAVSDLTKAVELGEATASTYFRRGRGYMELTRYKEAITDFSSALDRDPDQYDSRLDRGWVYGCLGEFQKSIQDLSQLLSKDPTDLWARSLRGWASAEASDSKSARADLEYAAEHGFKSPWLYLNLAGLYYESEELDKALLANVRIFSFKDDRINDAAYFQKGLILLAMGRDKEAREAYDAGRQMAEKSSNRVEFEDAIENLRGALEEDQRIKDVAVAILKTLEDTRNRLPSDAKPVQGICKIPRQDKAGESKPGLTLTRPPAP